MMQADSIKGGSIPAQLLFFIHKQQSSPQVFRYPKSTQSKTSSRFQLEQNRFKSTVKMQFAKLLAIVTIFAGGALAAPNKPKPPPPPPSPTPVQTNACGNGATPYCCNTDTSGSSGTPYGYSSCYAYRTLSRPFSPVSSRKSNVLLMMPLPPTRIQQPMRRHDRLLQCPERKATL